MSHRERLVDLFRQDTADAVERYGPLEGTESQIAIAEYALEHPENSAAQCAEAAGVSVPWVEKVVPRISDEFVAEYIDGDAPPIPDGIADEPELPDSEAYGPEHVVPERFAYDGNELIVTWNIDGEQWTELHGSEHCEECGERQDVTYLVPSNAIRYATPKACGHGAHRFEANGVNSLRTFRQTLRDALEQLSEESLPKIE